MPSSSRATWRVLAVLLTALFAAAACGSSTPTESLAADSALPTEVPAGTKLVIADQQEYQQTLLRASGELENLPFDVEFANFVGGPAILEAFRANTADVAQVGDTPPIHALVAGEDVPIILARQNNKDNVWLAVAPGSDVETLADLRGKRIAYAEGTAQQVIVLRALEQEGLTTDDVELVRLQLAEFSEALGARQVDVAPLNEPRLTRYLRDGGSDGATYLDSAVAGEISEGLSYIYTRRGAL